MDEKYTLILGDCIEKMRELPEASIDAIICDPPYGIDFMGKDWDSFNYELESEEKEIPMGRNHTKKSLIGCPTQNHNLQEFNFKWATEALRVLKTGGFLFAMGGTRTHHRLTCGIEDTGFLIRDELCWVYMQGFPKAQDLASMISKRGGAVRGGAVRGGAGSEGNTFPLKSEYREYTLTENGKQWQGWKTPALKPAFEPIIVAQKPCENSITENVMKYRVGGYNIDECRIPYENEEDKKSSICGFDNEDMLGGSMGKDVKGGLGLKEANINPPNEKGRFPSNILMTETCFKDDSKFFILPKANKGEKEENLNKFDIDKTEKTLCQKCQKCQKWQLNGDKQKVCICEKPEFESVQRFNSHPTVKPILLMEHLIKLTTTNKAVILDCFMGSGTTGVACANLNRKFIGIEKDVNYFKIAQKRISEAYKQEKLDVFMGGGDNGFGLP